MSMRDYYIDSIYEPLLCNGWHFKNFMFCWNVEKLTKEIADSVEIAIDNESMASGRDCIPNPLESELCNLQRIRVQESKDFDKERERHESEKDDLRRTIGRLSYELERANA